MSDKLQQAISATRAGDKREAQQLLAKELEENPNNEHAWFLLGNLVDSPEKRIAYLGKALAINPQYEKAKQQYVQVQRQVTAAAAITESEAEETLVLAITEGEVLEEPSDLPEWLTEEMIEEPEEMVAEEAAMIVDETVGKTAVTPPAKTDAQVEREKQLQRYNYILAVLVILIIFVLIALIVF